jgi:tRNA-specific 2-thiouridylase
MIDMNSQGKKVFIGLSGGVDSAVSAALLQKAGYDVTGVFIKVWQPDWIECTWREDRREAMRVAAHLGIPFVTLDLEKEYKKDVIDYMIEEYSRGRTPNPDVMCNRYVKFGAFWKWAKEQGADYVATGHYARNRKHESGIMNDLLAGVDQNKDQSYFLWTLNQNDLPHILFPVGDLPKPEVRKLALKFKLPNAERKDSQGLCFIGKVDIKEFLSHYVKSKPGKVLDENGEEIGTHDGALFYTLGERHGFTIKEKSPNDSRLYVISKDMAGNTITVTAKDTEKQNKSEVIVKNTNWVSGSAPMPTDKGLQARTRYRQPLQNITIVNASNNTATIRFENTLDLPTSGQSLVIYNGEKCLGGGIIE